jgi:transposase-like protein
MGKSDRKATIKKASAEEEGSRGQKVLPIAEVLVSVQEGLRDLVIGTGLQVLEAMLEEDRKDLCGPARKKQADRQAYRHGFDKGQLVLGGRKISVRKPRVRSTEGQEVPLPSWETLSDEDPLDERVVEQVTVGVSSRNYERSLEELPDNVESIGAKKSSVSRRFVARTVRQVDAFLGRPLEDLDLPIIMIDGTELGDRLLLVVLGVDFTGRKHVLGIREGVTESYETCRSLWRDLIGRGLEVERPRLFVIDGSKGLRKAIRRCFGEWALIQRCQVHKMTNVVEHLPQNQRGWVRAEIRRAWQQNSETKARVSLTKLIARLEKEHPGAAASLREGMDDTLTLLRLGAHGSLYRTLRSTNLIENLQGTIKRVTRNVKYWRDGSMVMRWAVTGLLEAESNFRRINGCRGLPYLLAQLENATAQETPELERKIA